MSRTNKTYRRVMVLGVPVLVAGCVLFGILRPLRHPGGLSTGPSGDGKAAIYKFLATQTRQKEFKSPIDLSLPDQVSMLRSNANTLEQRKTAILADLRRAEADAALVQKNLDALRDEVLKRKRAAGESKTRLGQAESRVPADQNEIVTLRSESEKNQAAWMAKREELSSQQAQADASGQKNRAELADQLQESERELQAVRKELRPKESELSGLENAYIRSTRQQAGEAGSYEALYIMIGQQLASADQLLAGRDVEGQRMGLSFAREACRHAGGDAHNGWLAARIAEAYLWPNLALADYTPGSKERALDLLRLCKSVFAEVGETKNLVRNYELMIAQASTLQEADTFRLTLADLLESTGDYTRATRYLKEIQETNLVPTAAQNLVRIEQRIALGK